MTKQTQSKLLKRLKRLISLHKLTDSQEPEKTLPFVAKCFFLYNEPRFFYFCNAPGKTHFTNYTIFMNKKTLLAYAVGTTVLTLALAGAVFADDTSSTSTPPSTPPAPTVDSPASTTPPGRGVRNIVRDTRREIGPNATGTIMTSTTTRDTLRNREQNTRQQVKFIQSARVVWIRINATIIRLEKIVTKLDSRIAKIQSAGGDTTIAETDSTDAKTSLSNAQSDIDSIKSIITSVSSNTPPTDISTSTIKGYAQDAQLQVQTAQTDIETALNSLMGGLKDNAHASSTEVTN